MGKSASAVQIPGAPTDHSAAEELQADVPKAATGNDDKAEIARLRALLAAQAGGDPISSLVFEPVTPHGAAHLATSKHKHLTSTELDAMVRAGEAKLVDHHVLCKDGWYTNPNWSANGG